MEIIKVCVNNIKPYIKNAKEHPEEQIQQIIRSINEFGFNDPIAIDENNVVIEGHGRLEAIKRLKYEDVECIRLSHLSDKQKKAYIIAHNKLTLNTGFDMDILLDELKRLELDNFDITITGFDTKELDQLLKEEQEAVEDDFDTTPPEVAKSKLGDLWILGRHRLLCGDSTTDDVDRLIEDDSIDLVVTDPPYNVDYGSKAEAINQYGYHFSDRHIKNDYMPEAQFIDFLDNAFRNMNKKMKNGAAFYIYHASTTVYEFEHALRLNNMKSRQQLIWNKNSIVLGRQDYQWKHEPCLYGWKEGAAHYFVDARTNATVFEDEKPKFKNMKKGELVSLLEEIYSDKVSTTIINEDKPSRSEEHPTMKPLKLLSRHIMNSSKRNDKILDLFGGSGSTLITAEQLGRTSYLVEFDEKYVDVIVNRYHSFTHDESIKLIRDGVEYTYSEIMGGE